MKLEKIVELSVDYMTWELVNPISDGNNIKDWVMDIQIALLKSYIEDDLGHLTGAILVYEKKSKNWIFQDFEEFDLSKGIKVLDTYGCWLDRINIYLERKNAPFKLKFI